MSPTGLFAAFTDPSAPAAAALLLKVTVVLGAAWALAAILRRPRPDTRPRGTAR